jgi:hypothetical protein
VNHRIGKLEYCRGDIVSANSLEITNHNFSIGESISKMSKRL